MEIGRVGFPCTCVDLSGRSLGRSPLSMVEGVTPTGAHLAVRAVQMLQDSYSHTLAAIHKAHGFTYEGAMVCRNVIPCLGQGTNK
jgi:hypothetical protein